MSAKLFLSMRLLSAPIVFGLSCSNHDSSRALNGVSLRSALVRVQASHRAPLD
jgi:hypothetical protein